MTSKRNRDYSKTLLDGLAKRSGEPSPPNDFSPITSVFKIMQRQYREHIEHLFDMLPIVWGLESSEFEDLLGVPRGWLDAYRIHEVKPDDSTWDNLEKLLSFHFAMQMVVEPRGYAEWLRRPWTAASQIGAQSPLGFIQNGGEGALKLLKQICLTQTQ